MGIYVQGQIGDGFEIGAGAHVAFEVIHCRGGGFVLLFGSGGGQSPLRLMEKEGDR